MNILKKNAMFQVLKTNETTEGFLKVTGYISEADKVMEYVDWWNETVTREIIPIEELEKVIPQTNGLIMTDLHPWEFIDAKNAKEYIRGYVTDVYGIEDKKLKVDLLVIDSDLINDIRSGKKNQFSIGYWCEMMKESGYTDSGEMYDYKQVNLTLNHVALVPQGRAGEEVGVITMNSEDENISYQKGMYKKQNTRGGKMAIKYNGKEMEAHELHSELILRDSQLTAVKNEKGTLEGKLAAKEVELQEANAKLNGFEERIKNEVATKINAISEVSKLTGENPDELVKLNTMELKKKVINKAFSGMDLENKEDSYINGVYEASVAKLNSSLPVITEGEGKKEKENGMDKLKKAVENMGGAK